MEREAFLRDLRRYCRKRGLRFEVDKRKGNGSHYRVEANDRWTIVPAHLNPVMVKVICRQLGIDPADL